MYEYDSELERYERRLQRKKDRIKNFAIVFLVVLLLLTFFSQTFMNYSLPQVAAQAIAPGQISPKIRGTGTAEADDPYHVKVNETRKVSSVAVKVGDPVQKDQVIYYLADKESEELEKAQKELDDMQLSYEKQLMGGVLSDAVITRLRNGYHDTLDGYQARLRTLQDSFKAAEKADEDVALARQILYSNQAWTDAERAYAGLTYNYADYDTNYEMAEKNRQLESLSSRISDLQAARAAITDKNSEEYAVIGQKINDLTAQQNDLQAQIRQLQGDNADSARYQAQWSNETAQVDFHFASQQAGLDYQGAITGSQLKQAERERTEKLAEMMLEMDLVALQQEMAKQREKVEELKARAVGATINAPVNGTISSLSLSAGDTTPADESIAVIQQEGKPLTCSFTVTADQAKNLKPGSEAEPQNSWYYTQFRAVLRSIKPDKQDPAGHRLLTFEITSPEVTAGQSVSLQIGESVRGYDMTVPNSAVREDNNGKFILIIQSKPSPLGNRYYARRADVQVLASDDRISAISASVDGYEYVITTTTVPVKAGDQVRLSNENS